MSNYAGLSSSYHGYNQDFGKTEAAQHGSARQGIMGAVQGESTRVDGGHSADTFSRYSDWDGGFGRGQRPGKEVRRGNSVEPSSPAPALESIRSDFQGHRAGSSEHQHRINREAKCAQARRTEPRRPGSGR